MFFKNDLGILPDLLNTWQYFISRVCSSPSLIPTTTAVVIDFQLISPKLFCSYLSNYIMSLWSIPVKPVQCLELHIQLNIIISLRKQVVHRSNLLRKCGWEAWLGVSSSSHNIRIRVFVLIKKVRLQVRRIFLCSSNEIILNAKMKSMGFTNWLNASKQKHWVSQTAFFYTPLCKIKC